MKKNVMRMWLWAPFIAAFLCFLVPDKAVAVGPYVAEGQRVLDQGTGLEWQQSDSGAQYNWEGALSYCENLELDGFSDWRLPNIKELRSIVGYTRRPSANYRTHDPQEPLFDSALFQGTPYIYWSSTSVFNQYTAGGWDSAHVIDFFDGTEWLGGFGKDGGYYVYFQDGHDSYERPHAFCVRGGLDAGASNVNVSSIAPAAGIISGGTVVTVTGSGFGPSQGGGSVVVDGIAAVIVSWSTTRIDYVAPAHAAGLVDVVVTTSSGKNFTAPAAFTYSPDQDGDGSLALVDNDDNDNTVYPGASELCDVKDNNQDGQIDGHTRLTRCAIGGCSGVGIETCTNGIWGGDTCEANLQAQANLVCKPMIDTGQSKCFDNYKEIPCPAPGQAFHGQDAQYQGETQQAFLIEFGGGTVMDLNTDLEWQRADDGVKRTWQAATDYCVALYLDGHDDWRLPTRWELSSIVDFSRFNPSINKTVFSGKADNYWSSTQDSSDGCGVSFFDGTDESTNLSTNWYVRCVRAGR